MGMKPYSGPDCLRTSGDCYGRLRTGQVNADGYNSCDSVPDGSVYHLVKIGLKVSHVEVTMAVN